MIIMQQNNHVKILLAACLAIVCSCSSSMVNTRTIKMEMSKVKRMILNDAEKIIKLKDKRINDKGFFYVIDLSGRVIYHPQELLIGRNFSDYWFIKYILKQRSGCLSYTVGGLEHFIFFENLQREQLLCYSIAAADLEGSMAHCKKVTPEDVAEDEGGEEPGEPVVEPQGADDDSAGSR